MHTYTRTYIHMQMCARTRMSTHGDVGESIWPGRVCIYVYGCIYISKLFVALVGFPSCLLHVWCYSQYKYVTVVLSVCCFPLSPASVYRQHLVPAVASAYLSPGVSWVAVVLCLLWLFFVLFSFYFLLSIVWPSLLVPPSLPSSPLLTLSIHHCWCDMPGQFQVFEIGGSVFIC